jgi:glycosyltransferase involved in cell wall biosynthesis
MPIVPVKPKILFISSFLPRKCGIASFTNDLVTALRPELEDQFDLTVFALDKTTSGNQYALPVEMVMDGMDLNSCITSASLINKDPAVQLVCIEHEFGLFGGDLGGFLLGFLALLEKPFIVRFHTVLPEPDVTRLKIVQSICMLAEKIIVMTAHSSLLLTRDYQINTDKIAVIPHGTHVFPLESPAALKEKFNLVPNQVLSTFGLLSPNKGIETGIRAMEQIVKTFPQAMYLIIGKTHPNLIAAQGEQYREGLEELIKEKHLEHNVRLINEYLPTEQLMEYLTLTDIYLFTSRDPNQAVSGTFIYAMSAGCAIISNAFVLATEMLDKQTGVIIDSGNDTALAANAIMLLQHESLRLEMGRRAFAKTRETVWTNVAHQHALLFYQLVKGEVLTDAVTYHPIRNGDGTDTYSIPDFNLMQIRNLTDDTGIIQHALRTTPNRKEGYCIDDNARALLFAVLADKQEKNADVAKLTSVYLSFIHYMQMENGYFKNFMGYNKDCLEEQGSEDAFGRTLMALGYLVHTGSSTLMVKTGEEIFLQALPHVTGLVSPRAIASSIIGVCQFIQFNYPDDLKKEIVVQLANKLVALFEVYSGDDWQWFENSLTYDNAMLPLALLHAFEITRDKTYLATALASLAFLESIVFHKGVFRPVGNQGWCERGTAPALFDQQGVDTMGMVLLYQQAFNITSDKRFLPKLHTCYQWFLGKNDLGLSLYDPVTGGCADGLQKEGINHNQGAESTLSYWISHLAITAVTKELKYQSL